MRVLVTSVVDLRKSLHNRSFQFIKHLCARHKVTVVSINDWWKGDQDDLEKYSEAFQDVLELVDYRLITENRVSPIVQELYGARVVKEISREGFDVHLDYNTLASGYPASKVVPTVYDLADDLPAMIMSSPQIPRSLRPVGAFLGEVLMQRNFRVARKITAATKVLVESLDIPRNKCQIITNGVDTNLFGNQENAREALGIEGFVIGFVGALREWVDFKPVFEAMKGLSQDIRIVIVGKEGNYEGIAKLAQESGLGERVDFTGLVSYSEVPKYMSAMDVCLIPFRTDKVAQNSLPLKLFEYMACEKPVVSTDLRGIRDAVGDIVLYAGNPDQYHDVLERLYNDSNLRRTMGRKGRELVESTYDWEVISRSMENVLVECANR